MVKGTTIRVSKETRIRLEKYKGEYGSFDGLINFLLDLVEGGK